VAHQRLSERIAPWTAIYERGLFAGPRMVTYADVRGAYPDYQLPRGTYGWEPSTRTVNGGPGWAAPPKAAPKLTRPQKVKRELRWAVDEMKEKFRWLGNQIMPKIEKRVDAGIKWYEEAISAAVYGILSGVGLWILILVGVQLHLPQRFLSSATAGASNLFPTGEVKEDSLPDSESRVDKVIGNDRLIE